MIHSVLYPSVEAIKSADGEQIEGKQNQQICE
jgi:hypothetical protein